MEKGAVNVQIQRQIEGIINIILRVQATFCVVFWLQKIHFLEKCIHLCFFSQVNVQIPRQIEDIGNVMLRVETKILFSYFQKILQKVHKKLL
jgi:hypothetical protein